MVMYISVIDWVRAVVMVPMVIRSPPSMTTGRLPKRLLITVERGAVGKTFTVMIITLKKQDFLMSHNVIAMQRSVLGVPSY